MNKERKVAAGIALRPALWRRIERVADEQAKSRNEVMEAVLDMYVPTIPDLHNPRVDSRNVQNVEFE